MSLLNRIIGRVNIINLHYHTGTDYNATTGCYAIKTSCFEKESDLPDKNAPNIVIITGMGVISKRKDEMSDNISKRIDKDSFLSMTDQDGILSFVRKQQVENVPYQSVIMTPAARFDINILSYLWSKEVSFKTILKFTRCGNIISRTIFTKIKLPILFIFLLALVCNFYFTSETEKRFASNQVILNSFKEKRRSEYLSSDINFSSDKINPAYLSDRIGASTPELITLTGLSIQFIKKKLEPHKEIQIDKNLVVISGYTDNTEYITDFVNNLNNRKIARELILSSIERSPEKNVVNFKITLKL